MTLKDLSGSIIANYVLGLAETGEPIKIMDNDDSGYMDWTVASVGAAIVGMRALPIIWICPPCCED